METITDQIINALRDVGPMTVNELCLTLGLTRYQCNQAVRGLRKRRKTVGKRVYITAWVRDAEGQRAYIYPVFALGRAKDAQKPPRQDDALRMRIRRAHKRARAANCSVFSWAQQA